VSKYAKKDVKLKYAIQFVYTKKRRKEGNLSYHIEPCPPPPQ